MMNRPAAFEHPAPPADDRQDVPGGPVTPGVPGTLRDLLAIWRDRDVQYAQNPRALTEEQIASIRTFRIKEVNDLPPAQRAKGWIAAKTWVPPQHGQGTGDDAVDGLEAFA